MVDKVIYLVRHCKATGQDRYCELTEEGTDQAQKLAAFFESIPVNLIISSPFTRAIQSIIPTAEQKGLDILVKEELSERVLSGQHLDDWMEQLRKTYIDFDMKLPGGESNREAQARGIRVIHDVKLGLEKTTILVSHGGLISCILNYFDPKFGFEEWQRLSNPDVYKIDLNRSSIERVWMD